MNIGKSGFSASARAAALCLFLCFFPALAGAQTKPPESTSKIKKVMLYNKIGGWMISDGITAVNETFSKLAVAKGFELVQLDTDSAITLDYLKQFQVIVWNNNTNGGASVPSLAARQAILDYLDQGGGWMLIDGAGEHYNSWPGLAETMGTGFARTGNKGQAEVVLDGGGRVHKELKWMLEGFPDVFVLEDRWLGFLNTVRPLPGVTVVATTSAIPAAPYVLIPIEDGSRDNVYLWAREVGQGRFFYNAIGFGFYKLMEQQDSIVPRLYWENIRYAAGDFQNGCTTPNTPGFDPAARVHVAAMCTPTDVHAEPALTELVVSRGSLRMRIDAPGGPTDRPFRARLRDLRGALVWERTLPAGTREIALDGAFRPGVYHLEILGTNRVLQRRLALP